MATELAINPSTTTRPAAPVPADTAVADRVIVIGVWLAVVLALGQIVTQVIDYGALNLRVAALNSDVHMSIFGIVSLLAMAGAVAAVAARCLWATGRARTGWLLLCGLITVLLIVRITLPDDPVALAIPVAIAFVLFWALTMADYGRARTVTRIALLSLAISFVIHIVGPKIIDALGYGYGTWAYEIKALSKHTAELVGWILISAGMFAGGLAQGPPAWPATRSRRRR
jgi:hypothetical protein